MGLSRSHALRGNEIIPHIAEVEHSYSSVELLALLHESFAKSDTLLNQLKQELGK